MLIGMIYLKKWCHMKSKPNVVIVGGHEQACRILDYLVETGICNIVLCVARKDDSGADGIFPSLISKARSNDIPMVQPSSLNSPALLATVEKLMPDLVLSLQNNMIFGEAWINLLNKKLGIVNVHYAPLPKYGGYWPEMWAIWNDEKKFAVTMHYVEVGLDTGPIIAQKWFEIDSVETRQSLYSKSGQACFELLSEKINEILSARVECFAQNHAERTYFPKSLPNNGFLDLEWSAEKQSRFLRAISYPGFPGPKIRLGDQVVTVVCEDIPFFTAIGSVIKN